MIFQQNREALENVKRFAENWDRATQGRRIVQTADLFRQRGTMECLMLDELNQVIALAEQAVHDADNPPRGGH